MKLPQHTLLASALTAALALTLSLSAGLSHAQQTPAAPAAAAPVYKAKSPKLGRAELDALLAKPEQVVVVDVRRPDELTAIGGFPVYLSIQSKELEKSLAFIPRDRAVNAGRQGHAVDRGATVGGDFNSAREIVERRFCGKNDAGQKQETD